MTKTTTEAPPAIWAPLKTLKKWRDNVKSDHDVEGVAESIRLYGWGEVIVARKVNRQIIAGHGRAKASALLAKMWKEAKAADRKRWHAEAVRTAVKGEVPVRLLDISARDAAELAVSLNRLAELSSWNEPKLHKVVARATKARLRAIGFTAGAITRLGGRARSRHRLEDGPQLTPPAEPITQPGDQLILGAHRVICADTMVPETLTRLFAGAQSLQATAVVTDPPFAIYGSSSGNAADVADDRMVQPFFEAFFRGVYPHLPLFAHVYAHTDFRSWAAIWRAAIRAGMTPKNCLVWDKGNAGLGSMWRHCHEFIGFWVKEPPPKVSTMRGKGAKGAPGQREVLEGNILRHSRVAGAERLHNAAKPLGLEAELIEASTDEGEIVLDPFLGSGTTLIACEKLNRVCFGVEVDPKWCDVTAARWERETGGKAERVPAP